MAYANADLPKATRGIRAGDKHHRLTALAPAGKTPRGMSTWLFRCDCGAEHVAVGAAVRSGNTKSCGCLNAEKLRTTSVKHGHARGGAKTAEYRTWINIVQRCTNPNRPDFERYGGRGITVCDRWRESYEAFAQDMGPRPSSRHTLDRRDNNKGYTPDNCRWVEHKVQARNKRNNRLVSFMGRKISLAEACELADAPYGRVVQRMRRGEIFEQAIQEGSRRGL